MLEPSDLYQVETQAPDLNGTVLLCVLNGFMDAGYAGKGVADHLLSEFEHEVLVRFDVDQLLDYRSRRPQMTFESNRWSSYDTPELALYLLHDESGAAFLLLAGSEPDLQWERFVVAVRQLIHTWGVRLTIGFHGIPMGTPHTRPLGVTSHANRRELLTESDSTFNQLEVPGSALALLELRLGEWEHDAMGHAVHVPHYLSQTNYPAASVRLLETVVNDSELSISDEPLRESAREVDAEVDAQVRDSEEVTSVVEALERQYDMFTSEIDRRGMLAESVKDLPSADELGDELEQYLAEQRGTSDS